MFINQPIKHDSHEETLWNFTVPSILPQNFWRNCYLDKFSVKTLPQHPQLASFGSQLASGQLMWPHQVSIEANIQYEARVGHGQGCPTPKRLWDELWDDMGLIEGDIPSYIYIYAYRRIYIYNYIHIYILFILKFIYILQKPIILVVHLCP